MGTILRQSTAVDVLIGPFVDDADGNTEEGGLTIAQADVRLSKNGQTAAQKNDNTTCAHDADGMYNCELDATDTNTVGELTLYVHVAGALFVRHDYQIIEEAVYDQLFAASAPGAASASKATQIYSDSTKIESKVTQIYSDTTIIYSDTTIATSKAVQIYSDTTIVVSDTTVLEASRAVIAEGTAQAATGTTLQLASATAFSGDNDPVGATIVITGGSAGVGQARTILSYVTATDTATVDTWSTTPTGTITYKVFATPPQTAANDSKLTKVSSKATQIYSDTTIATSKTTQIYSDTTAIHTQTTTASSKAVQIYSDTTIAVSKAVQIYSDTTKIHSDTTVIEAGGGSLTAAQDSKLTRVNSKSTQVYSDTTAIEAGGGSLTAAQDSKLTRVNSKSTQVYSDTTAIHTQTTTASSKATQIYSDTTIAVSKATQIYSDTTIASAGVVATYQKNVAASDIPFVLVDSTDHVTRKTGITVTATRSIDGGAFGAATGTVAEIANGVYVLDASQADMNGNNIVFRFTGAACDPVELHIKTYT